MVTRIHQLSLPGSTRWLNLCDHVELDRIWSPLLYFKGDKFEAGDHLVLSYTSTSAASSSLPIINSLSQSAPLAAQQNALPLLHVI